MREFLVGFLVLAIAGSPFWGLMLVGHLFGAKIVEFILIAIFAIMGVYLLIASCKSLGSVILGKMKS